MSFRRVRSLRLPTTQPARGEALALVGATLLFLIALVPALSYARREHRDGVRRALLREVKQELELWFNEREGFPLHPSGDLGHCGSTDDTEDWFFAHFWVRERKKEPLRILGNDRQYPLRYCPTARAAVTDGQPPAASGFILEAVLEHPQPERVRFNFEHNIGERTVNVDGRSAYRICGGTETQCGTEKPNNE